MNVTKMTNKLCVNDIIFKTATIEEILHAVSRFLSPYYIENP